MDVAANYISDIQGLFILLGINGTHSHELVELLEIIDVDFKGEVDMKSFSNCFFADNSKLFRFFFDAFVAGFGADNGFGTIKVAAQQKRSSYFFLLSFILLLNGLKRSEYLPFILWLGIQQDDEKYLDRVELTVLMEKLGKHFSYDDQKLQSTLAKKFFQFQKLLETDGDEIASKSKTGHFRMEDIISLELRSGQPFTSLLDILLKTFRENTLGTARWREIAGHVRESMDGIKDHYESLVEETHSMSAANVCQPHFDQTVFHARKHARKQLRMWIRYLQKFKFHVAAEEGSENEDDEIVEGTKEFKSFKIHDDDRPLHERLLAGLGFVSRPQRSGSNQHSALTDRKLKQRQQRALWIVEDSSYIEEAKSKSKEEVVALANSLCDMVDDITELCRDALG
jgi:hypothetical protein